jgi:membrane fusion protein (multidrug efflux system)
LAGKEAKDIRTMGNGFAKRFIPVFLAFPLMSGYSEAQTPVIVSPVKLQSISDRIEALGTLRPNESVELTALVTETVSRINFDDGDRVTSGQILVEMTNAEEQALLAEARARAAEAKSQYERVQSLEAKGTASTALLDEELRDWQTAQAMLRVIESRLADRIVRAPFDGIVGLRNVSVGTLVEPGDLITTLDDDSRMKLDVPVPSTFLGELERGLPVRATTRAYGARVFNGEIKSIDSRVDPVTRSVIVRVLLPNSDQRLKPGMLMQVEFLTNPREALLIPESALLPLRNIQYVLIVKEGTPAIVERRQVEIGRRLRGWIEILDGLSTGEQVVTHGSTKVQPGNEVTIKAVDHGDSELKDLLKRQPATVSDSES